MKQDAPLAKRDLIIASVADYGFHDVKPFLVSLKQTGFDGDVVFFCTDIDPVSLSQMEKMGVHIINVPSYRFRRSFWLIPKIITKICQVYYAVRWPFFDKYWYVMLALVKQRFYYYHQFLLKNGANYNRVFFTDVRDVYFQKSPFAEYPGQDLVFFEEDPSQLLSGGINNIWLARGLGKEAADQIGDKITLCAGTIMGTSVALIDYLERFLRMLKASGNLHSVFGEDQAIHNVLAYQKMGDCPFSLFIAPNVHGPVYTVGGMKTEDIRLSPDHDILFPDGRVAPIIHQYDRHPAIARELLAKIESAEKGSPTVV